jgi:hypothetical protein
MEAKMIRDLRIVKPSDGNDPPCTVRVCWQDTVSPLWTHAMAMTSKATEILIIFHVMSMISHGEQCRDRNTDKFI